MSIGRFFRMAMLIWLAAATAANVAAVRGELTYDRRTPVVKVYQKTHKAVVNIAGERVVSTLRGHRFDWPDMFDLWGPRYQQRVAVLGSGLVVQEDGYIVTNAHVVKGGKRVKVVLSDGREFEAEIVNMDEGKDLAVLAVSTKEKLPFIELGRSNDLMIGETVIAIGNPYGFANTVTSGVISAVGRDIEVAEDFWLRGLIQTDAPINPGNSGGPLLNINGELIGINTAIRAEAQNIGFAIPVDTLVDNLREMLMPEKLRRVRLGLVVGRTKTVGQFTGLAVESITKESPADKKGIAAGDIIIAIDGKKLSNVIDFYVGLIGKEVGEPIDIEYVKPGGVALRSRTTRLMLEARPLPDGRQLASTFFQMDVSELNSQVARRFGFESAYPILIITGVESKGTAGSVGLAAGDLILEINGTTVSNMKELSLEMEKIHEGDAVEFKVMRIGIGIFGQIQRQYKVMLRARRSEAERRKFSFGQVLRPGPEKMDGYLGMNGRRLPQSPPAPSQ